MGLEVPMWYVQGGMVAVCTVGLRTQNLEFVSVVWSTADGLQGTCRALWISIPTQTGFSCYTALTDTQAVKGTSLSALQQISTNTCQEYEKAKRTQEAYSYYVKMGKAFLAVSVAEQQEQKVDVSHDGIATDLWAKAFDMPPNRYSAHALVLFLSKKCFDEEKGISTGQAIHTAFADYWDNM